MNKEIWKDIPEYEGLYQISNLGNVKSLPRFINNNSKSKSIGYYSKEKILKFNHNKKGYLLVKLYKNNEKHIIKVHRLVAEAFIPNPESKPQVNHINGIKTDNRVENLEWCTNQENVIHALKSGLYIPKRGKQNKLSKKVNQYDLEGNFIKTWDCIEEARKTLHISNISSVCHGKRKTAGGYKWENV